MLKVAAIGFSTRSLLDALKDVGFGLGVVAVDNFGDQDTQEMADDVLVNTSWLASEGSDLRKSGPRTIVGWLKKVARDADLSQKIPVFLAGGTENWPELLDELHAHFRVFGPDSAQISQLRSLGFWRQLAQQAGIGFPETAPILDNSLVRTSNSSILPTRDGAPVASRSQRPVPWLRKSLRGSGGVHIRRAESEIEAAGVRRPVTESAQVACDPVGVAQSSFLQREIRGRNLGVTWLASSGSNTSGALILGVTESLTAQDWPGPTEFIYRGSLGPIALNPQHELQLKRLGDLVVAETGLEGWFQADLIEDEEGQLWLLELNPRWTAGMEVLQLIGNPGLKKHILASISKSRMSSSARAMQHSAIGMESNSRYAAKAVLYTQSEIELTEHRLCRIHDLPRASFADLPSSRQLGETIPAGSPLLTVRTVLSANQVQDQDWQQVRKRLLNQLAALASVAAIAEL